MSLDIGQVLGESFENSSWQNVVVAIVVFVVGIILKKLILKALRKLLSQKMEDSGKLDIICLIVNFVLSLAVVIVTALVLGVSKTSVAAIVTALCLGITLALEETFANIAGGIVLTQSRIYKKDDWITVDGTYGQVVKAGLTHTRIRRPDNIEVSFPNKMVSEAVIKCDSATAINRNDTKVFLSADVSKDLVRQALLEAADDAELVLKDPKPEVIIESFLGSVIEYKLRYWMKTENYAGAYYQVNEKVTEKLEKYGIGYPDFAPELNLELK